MRCARRSAARFRASARPARRSGCRRRCRSRCGCSSSPARSSARSTAAGSTPSAICGARRPASCRRRRAITRRASPTWSGHPQRDLKTALAQLDAAAVSVEGMGEAYVRAADVAARPPAPRGMALVALEDNYLNNHGAGAVTDPRHHAFEVDLWGGSGKPAPIGKAQHMLSRTILVDGLVAGFWEVDPRAAGAVWHTFAPAPAPLARALDELTADTAAFLLEDVGHPRVFTLDTLDDVQARADRIAKLDGKPGKPAAKSTARPAAKAPPAKRQAR